MPQSKRPLIAYACLITAALLWSGNHVVGRAVAGLIPPIGISMARWLVPALILWPFAHRHLRNDWPTIRKYPVRMIWFGVTGGALFSVGQYVGLQYTSALNVSVLNSLVPVLIVAAGASIFADRIRIVTAAGIATSFLGVMVLITRADLNVLLSLSFAYGDIIIVMNMAVFAIYAATLRLKPNVHWISFTFVMAVIATLSTLPFAAYEWLQGARPVITAATLAASAYIVVCTSLVAFVAWNTGVAMIGAVRSGPFLHLIPVFTTVLGYAALNEGVALFQVFGFVLILMGVGLASVRS